MYQFCLYEFLEFGYDVGYVGECYFMLEMGVELCNQWGVIEWMIEIILYEFFQYFYMFII